MMFTPVLPAFGTQGWTFLKRTEAAQQATFARQPEIRRDEAYFRDRIRAVRTAEALVSDRRLLRITLEAFGLEQDVDARAFIRKVLEGGTKQADALANRLADPRYRDLAGAFGFDLKVPSTVIPDFADGIMDRWKDRRFEAAVGRVDNDLRLAMNARRELAEIAAGRGSEKAKWLKIMGNLPLRTVVQRAFGLPMAFARIDLDRQVAMLTERAGQVTGAGTVSQFADPARTDRLIRIFLAAPTDGGGTGGSATRLLLEAGAFGNRLLRRV